MLVIKNLLRRKVRTLLSVLGVALGIGAIIAFNAVGRGFKSSLHRYVLGSGAQMLVVNRMVTDPSFSRLSKEDQDRIRTAPGVAHLSPTTFAMASPRGLKVPTRMLTLLVFGRTPGDRLLEKYAGRVDGRLIAADDEVMLGVDAARGLGLGTGDTLELFHRPFRVVGVYRSDVKFESAGAVVPNSVIQQELRMGEAVSMGFVFLKEGADWRAVKAHVEEGREHLEAMRTDQFVLFYNQLEYIDWFVWIVSLVSVVVGALGVLNTMLMAVSERTREIGTLRALGWSRARVLRLVLAEGALISGLGGLLGLAAGWAGAEVLILWAPSGLDTQYTAFLFVQAMAVALGMGVAGAFYPAWQAGRLSPTEALKYE